MPPFLEYRNCEDESEVHMLPISPQTRSVRLPNLRSGVYISRILSRPPETGATSSLDNLRSSPFLEHREEIRLMRGSWRGVSMDSLARPASAPPLTTQHRVVPGGSYIAGGESNPNRLVQDTPASSFPNDARRSDMPFPAAAGLYPPSLPEVYGGEHLLLDDSSIDRDFQVLAEMLGLTEDVESGTLFTWAMSDASGRPFVPNSRHEGIADTSDAGLALDAPATLRHAYQDIEALAPLAFDPPRPRPIVTADFPQAATDDPQATEDHLLYNLKSAGSPAVQTLPGADNVCGENASGAQSEEPHLSEAVVPASQSTSDRVAATGTVPGRWCAFGEECSHSITDPSPRGIKGHLEQHHAPGLFYNVDKVQCRWRTGRVECGRWLLGTSGLAKHIARAHLKSTEVRCQYCNNPFCRPDTLVRHVKNVCTEARAARGDREVRDLLGDAAT
ncbi:uncharacterized protein C8Q71DRAFT_739489 [Rhodofomes roseus]|uniref:C2H2-type domain-containing protein n=1 Tax=Rhodofomes roseus TaxID=34475 RepID=A0ABQ8KSX2_9APHY|nr:uncharacterized protein C8Q71DRAFT_739489 [Rhodofomes roseus]KAH9841926.1 hypothetical protein C8Q71DRAFT_739489 [Rhodofomes roseus]